MCTLWGWEGMGVGDAELPVLITRRQTFICYFMDETGD